ncbi:uricase [Basidiobolus meristosporus CBS 931.73]|uniref:Uricase n=1 Tax=Basidiobolus meristosporus CBS 931.73 TaxID=1314790 RepID=A0A1Y1Z2S8_9FUNG|nr:uricase [Basidiobolus meristosporus CBS 931.73]|eukprot:ORY04247.1 uricase [Basidiobolus meristosporus CBS 931.73]
MSGSVELKRQAYGKAKVRVTKAIRHTAQYNDIVELTCQVLLEGDFEEAYTKADNSMVVPTDTVKNTCYVIAKKSDHVQTIERYAYELGKHFVDKYTHVTHAHVHIVKYRWARINVNGEPHPHSFYRDGSETRETWVTVSANDVSIKSGLEGLLVLKTTGSSFTNFHHCENTTLQDADDRIFSTTVKAHYNIDTSIGVENIPFDRIFDGVRKTTLDVFAHDDSASVQATMYRMAELILKRFPEVRDVYYALPNSHHFTTNLAPFNLPNAGQEMTIFSPVTDFSGYITATIGRRRNKF